MESEAGRVRCLGLRASNHSGRYPVAVYLRREVAGDINHGGGERRGEAGGDTRARGGDKPQHHSEEPVGPSDEECPTFQQPGPERGCHVADPKGFK